MSHPASRPPIEHFERLCRHHRIPLTVQRRTIFQLIVGRDDHPTADQVCEQARKRLPTISRTTVYRILDNLVELGVITRICHPGSAGRFDPKIVRHHHLVCMRCEKIIDLEAACSNDIPWPDVRRHGFQIRDFHIHFQGLCASCRGKGGKKRKSTAKTRGQGSPTRARVKPTRVIGKRRTSS